MSASERHPTDAELVEILDEGPRAAALGSHLDGCPDCRGRLEGLRRTAATLSELLELGAPTLPAPRYDPDVLEGLGVARPVSAPPAPSGGGLARARARRTVWLVGLVAAGLAGLVLASTPAGAWIADHLAALLRPEGVAAPPGPPAPATSSEAAAPTSVDFRATEPVLSVWLDGEAAPSAVVLRLAGGDLATAGVRPGRGEASVVVAPGGLHIRAGRADTLEVALPQALREVRIYVGKRLLVHPGIRELGTGPLVVPVSPGGPG